MNRQVIEQYAAGAQQPAQAIAGLSREQLNAFPVPGTWSIQQIVIHLMDSDLIGADRMKRVAAEDRPPSLIGYDESAFIKNLFPDELDPQLACEVFAKNRQITAEILKRLPDEAFSRTGNHNEDGVMTLEVLVGKYVKHLNHHLKFIEEKRKLLGCPA